MKKRQIIFKTPTAEAKFKKSKISLKRLQKLTFALSEIDWLNDEYFCGHCEDRVSYGDKFCSECGSKVPEDQKRRVVLDDSAIIDIIMVLKALK